MGACSWDQVFAEMNAEKFSPGDVVRWKSVRGPHLYDRYDFVVLVIDGDYLVLVADGTVDGSIRIRVDKFECRKIATATKTPKAPPAPLPPKRDMWDHLMDD